MFRTLYAKLAAGLFLLLVAIGLFYVFVSTALTRRHFETLNQQLNEHLARNIVADRNLVAEGRINAEALKKTFDLYMSVNPSIEIYLLDLDGKIISYSADKKKIKRQRVNLKPIKSFLAMDAPYPLLGDDPRSHDRQKAFSVTPVPSKEQPEGYLYVVLRGEQFDFADEMMRGNFILRLSMWTALASLALGLFAGLIAFHQLTRRLTRLSRRMLAFEQNNFTQQPVPPSTMSSSPSDEIDQLSLTFDRMAARIGEQIEALTHKDAMRRELVAQAAHDLRTPLTAMLGYVEALEQKADKLSPSERADFLRISLRQGRRLSGLVDELFELAGLDAKERRPDLEPFSLSELVLDITQKHRLKAEAQSITLRVDVPADLPFARGDIALTERVLDNLLENALCHAAGAGEIAVSGKAGTDSIRVSIEDNGAGIPDADLPHLFEPFFRGGANAFDNRHAGLGLAVAKRIMDLQGGEITAANNPQGGARFTIRLPRARSMVPEAGK